MYEVPLVPSILGGPCQSWKDPIAVGFVSVSVKSNAPTVST